MNFQEITALISSQFPDLHINADTKGPQPILIIPVESVAAVCSFLYTNENLYFDFLACITSIDNGPGLGTMELIYNMTSIPYGIDLTLKTIFPRNTPGTPLPSVPTVSHIWRTADWHEREAYDLMGIHFVGHPDLRRILLPEDWEGHPLRRDYDVQERYHGIYVRYEDGTAAPLPDNEDRA
ncbi:NADH-quinone oxidoreductase subunit C [Dyadobacter sp. CY323]|uniref:NADH-quinone oxidoreductase subunit C n=1 Tax=Dyadobacter sp. CY323 TaxID=2907302 RepID=UPI001F43E0ED|nr:NADH-quinone oxidoreductase subunit C [Dyadobacter sp. CY323]MCE6989441.1 NADH-quinone oxidoreductase subunit C [Dyadobacter sp. CY323]